MPPPHTAIHLCAGTDAAKTLLALREAGVRSVAVNTSTRYRLDSFDFAPERVPVAANLYERALSPVAGAARYALGWLGPLRGAALRASGQAERLRAACAAAGGADFVFAHWGSGITPELALLKGSPGFRELPAILNVETFPTAWAGGVRGRLESALLRKVAPMIAATIVPTQAMAALLERSAPELLRRPTLIAPFCFPRAFTATAAPLADPVEPGDDVVFTGWADLRYPVNDVRAQLLELARAGLVVHSSPTPGLEHANVRIFDRFKPRAFTSGEFASFMRRFRASLVTFNVKPGDPELLRFQTSLPTRLLFSLAVGVPVLIPRGRLPASERLVEEHEVGLVYDDPAEARERVLAPKWDEVRRRAFARRERFQFDAPAFLGLVERALAHGSR